MTAKRTTTLYVDGMHCAACEFYLEDTLGSAPGVCKIKADLNNATLEIETDGSLSDQQLADVLTPLIADRGYRLNLTQATRTIAKREFMLAIPAATFVIIAFVLLQRLGLVNLVATDSVSYATAILIGLIASVSSCLAVVGGLVLSLGASEAKAHGKWQSQSLFHVGRLLSFLF